MKHIGLFLIVSAFLAASCHTSPKIGVIRSGEGIILATNLAQGPKLCPAKWNVMGIRKWKDGKTTDAFVEIDSSVFMIKLGDTLRINGKPVYDSANKIFKIDTSWTRLSDPSLLTLSFLNVRPNPHP